MKEDQSEPLRIPTGTESILFVDDEVMLVEWAKAALEKLGCSAIALSDPAEPLKMFSSDPSRFDLIIMDQAMPAISGMQLARKLLTMRPDIPIVLCTGQQRYCFSGEGKESGHQGIPYEAHYQTGVGARNPARVGCT